MADYCTSCGSEIEDWDTGYWARSMLCFSCYERKASADRMQPCSRCGARFSPDRLEEYRKQHLCQNCLPEAKREAAQKECSFCQHWIEDWEKKFELPNGRYICQKCHDKGGSKGGTCARCGKSPKFPFFAPDGKTYCENCASQLEGVHQPMFARVMNQIKKRL